MIKPRRLKKGDTVAVLSPSWGGPSVFPHIYEKGLQTIQSWGLKVKEYPTARMDADYLRRQPEVRAQDINNAFADSETQAIITTIGGDDSVRILPYLDTAVIHAHPKIFLGYSDTTALHLFFNQLGLVTFHGPSIMAGLSQADSLPTQFKDHVHAMLFQAPQTYQYAAFEGYANGYPDWSQTENTGKTKPLLKTDGWHWLQGSGVSVGLLTGGCIEVLEMVNGTDFWPQKDYWKGKILFLETSEEKPSVSNVGHVLRNFGMQGIFDQIHGLMFGRARDYSDEEKRALDTKILSVVRDEFNRNNITIISNFDVGHTDPQLILPLGINISLDTQMKTVSLTENALL